MFSPFDESNTENAFELQKMLQATMSDNMVIRSEETLNAAMKDLLELEKRIPNCKASGSRIYNSGFHTALDLRDSIITAKMIVHAALLRKESRSAHVRTDFPDTLPEYRRKVFVLSKGKKGEIKVREHENSTLPEHLAKIVPEMENP
jgi:succinate dehydrogenase / fumarate reductase flavoprotein subunit